MSIHSSDNCSHSLTVANNSCLPSIKRQPNNRAINDQKTGRTVSKQPILKALRPLQRSTVALLPSNKPKQRLPYRPPPSQRSHRTHPYRQHPLKYHNTTNHPNTRLPTKAITPPHN